MKTYNARLNLPVVMWAIVEVEAKSQDEAERLALVQARSGEVDFESAGFDHRDAEVTDCEEVEA